MCIFIICYSDNSDKTHRGGILLPLYANVFDGEIHTSFFLIVYKSELTDYIFKDVEEKIESHSEESNVLPSFSKIADGDYLSSGMTEVK